MSCPLESAQPELATNCTGSTQTDDHKTPTKRNRTNHHTNRINRPPTNPRAKAKDITILYNLPVALAPAPAPRPEDAAALAELRRQLEQERQQRERERGAREQLLQQLQAMAAQQAAAARLELAAGRGGLALPLPVVQQQGHYGHLQPQQHHQQQQHWGPGPYGQHQQQQQRVTGFKRPADSLGAEVLNQAHSINSGSPGGPTSAGGSSSGATGSAAAAAAAAAALGRAAGSGGGGSAAAADGPAQAAALQLQLVPLPPWGAPPAGAPAPPAPVAPGGLQVVQSYACTRSRAFSLEGSMLLLAEASPLPGGGGGGGGAVGGAGGPQRLRKVSIFLPGAPTFIPLPGATTVRAVCPQRQAGSRLVAVGTQGAGLLVVSTDSNAVVHRLALPAGAAVWSAAWSRRCDQQLLLGLDQGRVALVDLRATGREHKGLVMVSDGGGAIGRQPLLSVAPLPAALPGGGSEDGGGMNAALVATPAGVAAWTEAGGGAFAQLLDAHALGAGSCEGAALHEPRGGGAPLLCASFRSKLAAGGSSQQQPRPALHALFGLAAAAGPLAPAAAAVAPALIGGSSQQQQPRPEPPPPPTAELSGHGSCRVVTAGAFARLPAAGGGEALAFFSGDERANTVAAWDCGRGAALRRGPWPCLEQPVVQVAAAARGPGMAPLIGALCESQLVLCEWAPDAY